MAVLRVETGGYSVDSQVVAGVSFYIKAFSQREKVVLLNAGEGAPLEDTLERIGEVIGVRGLTIIGSDDVEQEIRTLKDIFLLSGSSEEIDNLFAEGCRVFSDFVRGATEKKSHPESSASGSGSPKEILPGQVKSED